MLVFLQNSNIHFIYHNLNYNNNHANIQHPVGVIQAPADPGDAVRNDEPGDAEVRRSSPF